MSNKIRKKIHAFIIENCESEISSLSQFSIINACINQVNIVKLLVNSGDIPDDIGAQIDQIMDLILFVEEISGKEVDVEGLKPGAFKDIDTIIKNFVETEKKN